MGGLFKALHKSISNIPFINELKLISLLACYKYNKSYWYFLFGSLSLYALYTDLKHNVCIA